MDHPVEALFAEVDLNGDGKIQRNELIDFVRSGIAMSERERAVYKSRGGAQSIIIAFFDSIKEKIKVRHFIQNIWITITLGMPNNFLFF